MAEKKISYVERDFVGLRQELMGYVNTYYPDLISNFNDAALFSVFMDLNAAIGDNLHFHIDRSIQETVLQHAQQRSSIYNIARTYGLKIPGQRPSVALVDLSITVPVFGDKEDERYLGILRRGSQVSGGGQIFETVTDIDFSSPFNDEGYPNRLKIPNFNSNNILMNYTIVKREVVVNGITKVFKKVMNNTGSRQFQEIFLPEKNVLGVVSVIQKDGSSYTNVPSNQEFLGTTGKWYEMDALVEGRIFIPDPSKPSDMPGIKVGKYITTNNRFITEFTPQGYMKLTFGGGNMSADDHLREFARTGLGFSLDKYQNSMALGNTPKPNTTMFIQYRIGGGSNTNLGVNVINQVNKVDFSVSGPSENINVSVKNSLRCSNITAAVGGADAPTMEEVRNYVSFNFAAQNRAVTIRDYEMLIRKMPGQFGAPAKVSIMEEDNKIKINLLSYDTGGKLVQTTSNTLKRNLAEYLSNYRMMNDYIYISSGKVIDLGVDISVIINGAGTQSSTVANIIDVISTFFEPMMNEMGSNMHISELKSRIQTLNGVVSINEIKFFNKVGGQYSNDQTSQEYIDPIEKEIGLLDDTLFAEPDQIHQIRFPAKDIKVRVKNIRTANIS